MATGTNRLRLRRQVAATARAQAQATISVLEGRESDIMTVLFAAQKRLRVAGLFRRRYVAVTCAFALCLLLLAHKGTGNAEPETTHGRYVSALRHVAVSCHGNLACIN